MMSIQRAAGTSYFRESLVSNSVLPQLILVLPVESASFLGSYTRSPYKGDTTELSELSVTCEGIQVLYTTPLNTLKNTYVQAQHILLNR